MMAWAQGQRDLRDLAMRPARGFELDIVRSHHRSGMTAIVEALARGPQETVRCVHVFAGGGFEAVDTIAMRADTLSNPAAWSRTLADALTALSGQERRPLCLLLDAAQLMRPKEMLRFALALEWAARHAVRVSTRAVLLCRPSEAWDQKAQKWIEGWPVFPELFKCRRVAVFNFARLELEKLSARDLPKGLFEEAA
jgi:hypothetical protein